jgi:nucleotide-binding universal stress UspA family protein
MANIHHADILVTGYHGRKGPKEDPTVMGSNVNHLSINATKPVLIIKDPHTRD